MRYTRLHFPRFPFFTFFAIAAFALVLAGCKTSSPARGSADTLPQALLWKIEGKDIQQPSYLFGTIHLIPKADFFLPVGFDEAFAKVNRVVFEIDMDDMSDMGSLMGLLTNLVMKDGMTLKKLLTPEEYKEVSAYFEEMGLPMMLLNTVKPMFLSMLAEVNMNPDQMNEEDIVSYEMDIYEKANTGNKDVGGLETMAYQMSLFDSIPYRDQARMLMDAIRSVNAESDTFDEMVSLYKQQNIDAMVQMVGDEGESGLGDYEDILLDRRNQNWIPLMAKKMAKSPTLFAVGAGHLGGPDGVIRLLRKAGYTLTPVSVYRTVSAKRI